jgi:hypothetical protein
MWIIQMYCLGEITLFFVIKLLEYNRVQQGEKLMIIDPFEIAFFDEVVYDRYWPTFVMDAVA